MKPDPTSDKPIETRPLTDPERAATLTWLEFLEIFEGVPRADLEILLEDISEWRLNRGQFLMEGGIQSGVFLLRSGAALTSVAGAHGETLDMMPLEPGDIVGGLAALTRMPFALDVQATRETLVLRIDEAVFLRFMSASHQGALQVMRYISRWLMRSMRPPRRPRTGQNIALVAVAEGIDLDALGRGLAEYLATQPLAVELITPSTAPASAEVVCAIEAVNDVVIMTTAPEDPEWTNRAIANADRVLLVDAAGQPSRAEPNFASIRGSAGHPSIDLVTIQAADAAYPGLSERWKGRQDLEERMNIRQGDRADLEFLARMLVGRAVGLVLAGGGARGYIHLGVVRALREAGIPIDMVAGTSMGGIIGATVAYGWPHEAIAEALAGVFSRNSPVGDYTLPVISLVRGHRVSQRLRQTFGDLRLEQVWRPYWCVSTNLSQGRPFIHEDGPAWRALRATSALPGILPPVVIDGSVLVDGAILNNFPVDIMRRRGRGLVIGANIKADNKFLSTLDDITALGAWSRFRRSRGQPVNIFSIMSRTATISSLQQTQYCRGLADLLIEPPADDVGLFDWKALDRLAERSYRHTADRLEQGAITYETLVERCWS
ncbi:patatin-like phospholipase family protein [Thiocystis violacea]|uniref:patatin-like phospholipase family protein n=1 Tax=Thiocystis violacea TaxID=13725 RepID=UPI0019038680|nr:patatin-like phospholipase family protein [Thiocystis violacea]MBK1720260.1 hypothetical protein [Thiocystis violacea]